jgi:putative intracellular protease/amidase
VDIAIPLFDRFTALDAVGPYEVLSRIPGATVHFVAEDPGPKTTDTRMLTISVERSLADLPNPDVVLFPGGIGTRAVMHDEATLEWVRGAHETSRFTTSVCTGALVLAAAGILKGLEATTYWTELDELREFGATPVKRRVVEQGKVITAAGVSSGIDMALTLVARLTHENVAQAIQLGIEYDPQPPFDAGSAGEGGTGPRRGGASRPGRRGREPRVEPPLYGHFASRR